ncbi:sugar phosphate isomerase/epimerase [Paenibacillus sp. CGMCC 1.16610]|uniref:TIM barrel protein n=1 Tax=Paenibacillus anseongense TaxID=2682845 RepID=A0ABW9U3W8_9BACL|nr:MULTISPECIES: sugar phosphate isomerase/epimerase [Paenibacillus]MBA2938820.1 sugar phosphate isomerase/epimerase [Paenibacillus sp. CGMCC 1.16610]MVQ34782.1 TIM barrel protein [Paenibacillus anseongense]
MTIKLAFSRPTSTTEEQTLLFEQYGAVGYDGLQLKEAQYAPFLLKPEGFIEAWGGLSGSSSALITGGNLDDASVEKLRNVFHFASAVGTELIVYCHGIPRANVTPADIRRYADVLSDLGLEAQQQGLKLSLHHHFNNPVMHRDDFDIFFNQIKEHSIGLTVDTAHLVKSGIEDAAEIIRSFGHVIDNFHLKDFDQGEWKVLGQGSIDFGPIFQAIHEIGYQGWISADEESGGSVTEGMKDCYAFMKNGLN